MYVHLYAQFLFSMGLEQSLPSNSECIFRCSQLRYCINFRLGSPMGFIRELYLSLNVSCKYHALFKTVHNEAQPITLSKDALTQECLVSCHESRIESLSHKNPWLIIPKNTYASSFLANLMQSLISSRDCLVLFVCFVCIIASKD